MTSAPSITTSKTQSQIFSKEICQMTSAPSIIAPKHNLKYYHELHENNGCHYQFQKILKYTKHPMIRNILLHRQNNKCPVCGKAITSETASVHHKSYNYVCTYNSPYIDVLTHYTPVRQDPSFKLVPNCDQCFLNAPDKFAQCLSNLVMLDNNCHSKVHGIVKQPKVA